MYPALSIASPILGDIVLDFHAARFVAPLYHIVHVEKLLCLYTDRLRHFAGALVPLLTGEVVVIVRELAPAYSPRGKAVGVTALMANGPTFILGSHPCADFEDGPSPQQREVIWRTIMHRLGQSLTSGTLLDPLPMPPHGLDRLDVDENSGWGCRVSYDGVARLLDLRGTRLGQAVAPPRFRARMEREWLGQKSFPEGQRAFLQLGQCHFHYLMSRMWNDPDCDLHQVRSFADLSEDTRDWQSRGCSTAVAEHVQKICQALFVIALGTLPASGSGAKATWCPWHLNEGFSTVRGRGLMPVPTALEVERDAVFAEFGCRPRAECTAIGRKARFRARRVRREWLDRFTCSTYSEPSALEVASAIEELANLGWSLRHLSP